MGPVEPIEAMRRAGRFAFINWEYELNIGLLLFRDVARVVWHGTPAVGQYLYFTGQRWTLNLFIFMEVSFKIYALTCHWADIRNFKRYLYFSIIIHLFSSKRLNISLLIL